jgi:hypothetical protein
MPDPTPDESCPSCNAEKDDWFTGRSWVCGSREDIVQRGDDLVMGFVQSPNCAYRELVLLRARVAELDELRERGEKLAEVLESILGAELVSFSDDERGAAALAAWHGKEINTGDKNNA